MGVNNQISVDNNDNNDNNNSPRLKPAARILFCVLTVILCCVSSANPLGLVSLPFTVTAAALIVNLSLCYPKSDSRRWAVYTLAIPSGALALLVYPVADRTALAAAVAAVLFQFVLALSTAVCISRRRSRTAAIAMSAAAALLLWLAAGAIIVYFRYSSIDLSSVAQSLDDIVEPFRGYLKGFTYELDGEVVNYYSDADIEGLCEYLKSVMLGILGAAMTIISYAASLLTRLVARSFDRESMLPIVRRIHVHRKKTPDGPAVEVRQETAVWPVTLDNLTAFVYIGSYLLSVLLASDNVILVAGATAQNLMILLTPAFVYAGVREVMGGSGGAATSPSGCLIFAVAAVFVFVNPLLLAVLLAIIGVVATIRDNLRTRRIKPS